MVPGQFRTPRLSVSDWKVELADPRLRGRLEDDLAALLTPEVLKHLPPSMQLQGRSVSNWIDDRRAESDILLARQNHGNHLIGLFVLAMSSEADSIPSLHIGYLIAESAWGNGYASEMLQGLRDALAPGPDIRLIAGVGRDNPASARVLQKTGFTLWPERASETADIYVCHIS
ncbi:MULTISPECIES: GNAT family N-acetyltransferase [unclassified Ruegeria]|uniref:GNAT family N-acetyltransferase n=1 Tax=unclassified Ruegeria TaxID=2625375 RepID=UPI001AE4DDF8|nr:MULTISPECIES: GNAT family N-acetyltransferase [unclassified Ruegeria]